MNTKNLICAGLLTLGINFSARAQIFQPAISPADSLGKIALQNESSRQDSLAKIIMRDSLQLSASVITQIFTTKQNFFSQAQQIRTNIALSTAQKNAQLVSLLSQSDATIKSLMGSAAYLKYGAMGRKRLLVISN
jgi:hypothetical protein